MMTVWKDISSLETLIRLPGAAVLKSFKSYLQACNDINEALDNLPVPRPSLAKVAETRGIKLYSIEKQVCNTYYQLDLYIQHEREYRRKVLHKLKKLSRKINHVDMLNMLNILSNLFGNPHPQLMNPELSLQTLRQAYTDLETCKNTVTALTCTILETRILILQTKEVLLREEWENTHAINSQLHSLIRIHIQNQIQNQIQSQSLCRRIFSNFTRMFTSCWCPCTTSD